VFYPQPYLGEFVRKTPIAVVDDDHSALNRRHIQTLDADEAISVAVRAPAAGVRAVDARCDKPPRRRVCVGVAAARR
jgi:hypothetical protein